MGPPGVDGVTFEAIENARRRWLPRADFGTKLNQRKLCAAARLGRQEIPKDGGKVRVLFDSRRFRDRVVQGALKLILEPIFEADLSNRDRLDIVPSGQLMTAVDRVARAIVQQKNTYHRYRPCASYFRQCSGTIRAVGERLARRVDDVGRVAPAEDHAQGQRASKAFRKAGLSHHCSANLYLTEVDRMLEQAKETTRATAKYTYIEYARFADESGGS